MGSWQISGMKTTNYCQPITQQGPSSSRPRWWSCYEKRQKMLKTKEPNMQPNSPFIFNMSHILLTKAPLSWSELLRNIRFLLIFQVVTLVNTFSHYSELQFNSWPVQLCKLITTGSHQDDTICRWSGHEASECQMIGFSTYISSKFNRLYLYACTLNSRI